jgi:predicted metal-binding protein
LASDPEKLTETIFARAREAGLTEIGPLDPRTLEFHDWVREISAKGKGYDLSCACPPAVGTLADCRARCLTYEHMLLFNRVYRLEDSFDFEGMAAAMSGFKETVARFDELVRPLLGPCLFLTNEGCGRCRACTWPDAPCRFPETLHHSLEGYGFNVSSLAEQAGLRYTAGPDTVTFFGAVLF